VHKLSEKTRDEEALFVFEPSSIYTRSFEKVVGSSEVFIRKIVLPIEVVRSFEERAKFGDELGIKGLRHLIELANKLNIEVKFVHSSKQDQDPREAAREIAYNTKATLLTSDPLLYRSSMAMGIRCIYIEPSKKISLSDFFKPGVMSVHLKENVTPKVKKGVPGKWIFEEVSHEPIKREELESLVLEIMATVQSSSVDGTSFVEIDKPGSTIVQLKDYRIVITRPPFSDGLEVTAVKPIIKKALAEYHLPPVVVNRIEQRAEGILIAGPPGMGKSTFAQALAEFYRSKGKIVKTVESPRDLQLPPDITQYSKTAASSNEIHDVLLLSRPDYTIFDELRTDPDFDLFIDLRLTGIGMVGVIHSTSAIDAVQRFIHRVDLGLVPSIIDTILFMNSGEVESVYILETAVKTPVGLARADLARPTVIMTNLFTGKPEYELYVFGEKTFVVPISNAKSQKEKAINEAVEEAMGGYIKEYKVEIDRRKIKISIPTRYMRDFTKKVQKNLVKVGRRFGMVVELEQMRENQDFS
jgi:ATPase